MNTAATAPAIRIAIEIGSSRVERTTPPTAPPPGGPETMTRRTYYLAETDADALETAVAAIHQTLHGRIPKHQILGALLTEGITRRDAITQRLKDELRAELD